MGMYGIGSDGCHDGPAAVWQSLALVSIHTSLDVALSTPMAPGGLISRMVCRLRLPRASSSHPICQPLMIAERGLRAARQSAFGLSFLVDRAPAMYPTVLSFVQEMGPIPRCCRQVGECLRECVRIDLCLAWWAGLPSHILGAFDARLSPVTLRRVWPRPFLGWPAKMGAWSIMLPHPRLPMFTHDWRALTGPRGAQSRRWRCSGATSACARTPSRAAPGARAARASGRRCRRGCRPARPGTRARRPSWRCRPTCWCRCSPSLASRRTATCCPSSASSGAARHLLRCSAAARRCPAAMPGPLCYCPCMLCTCRMHIAHHLRLTCSATMCAAMFSDYRTLVTLSGCV